MDLLRDIRNKRARMTIIGLGYVGLPLAVEFAKVGFQVIGVEVDENKVLKLNQGYSYIPDMSDDDIGALVAAGKFTATADYSIIEQQDTINICVPTPLRKTRDPDLSYIIDATKNIRKHLRQGQLIILESTTYPGTTEEIVLPILQETGLKVGEDFFLAFSPERVDPGNKQYTTKNIPKVVGGITYRCTELAKALYEQTIDSVIPVSSTQVAEMVKLLENTFRSVNIALVNEMALMCHKLKIDVWEVIEAAKTKPFGFMPFYPGPGLGGHCLPIDPFYLSWKAKMNGFEPRFIELAGQINSHMPDLVASKIFDGLNAQRKSVNGAKIHIFGVAYKKDINDTRESPALDLIKILNSKGAVISYSDPYVPQLKVGELHLCSINKNGNFLKEMDCSVIVTDHSAFDYSHMVENSRLIIDTRNALKGVDSSNIIRL